MTDVGESALTKNKTTCTKYNGICHAFNDSGIAWGQQRGQLPLSAEKGIFSSSDLGL